MPVDSPLLFLIIGRNDNLIYQVDLLPLKQQENATHMSQFILHSALDIVDDVIWKNSANYLKVIDRFGNSFISSFITFGYVKFLLLHEKKDEDGIKNFFTEVYELYLKVLLNPFYQLNTPITSTFFDERVRAIAKKKLDVIS